MRVLPFSNECRPGTWKGGLIGGGRRIALVTCPDCGNSASLRGHTIRADGCVEPSLDCPHDSCTFHDWVKLEGWTP
jgi:hypothetical protein